MGRLFMQKDNVPRNHEPAGSPKPKRRPRWGNRCPHVIQVSIPAPHPRYGDKVAHFETSYVRDPDCGCS